MWPRVTNQERAKSHTPNVDRPPSRPPICRHGQIGRQLQASKYVPDTDHAKPLLVLIVLPQAHSSARSSSHLGVWRAERDDVSGQGGGGPYGRADPAESAWQAYGGASGL